MTLKFNAPITHNYYGDGVIVALEGNGPRDSMIRVAFRERTLWVKLRDCQPRPANADFPIVAEFTCNAGQ